MSSSVSKPNAYKVTFDENSFWVHLVDGRVLGVPLAYFQTLVGASEEKLKNYEISGNGTGLHWDELDEDISVENLILGVGDKTFKRSQAA